jgi:hypothetical protein
MYHTGVYNFMTYDSVGNKPNGVVNNVQSVGRNAPESSGFLLEDNGADVDAETWNKKHCGNKVNTPKCPSKIEVSGNKL